MCAVPLPCTLNDLMKIRMFRLPPKDFLCLLTGCDQHCRVPGPPAFFHCLDRFLRYLFCSLDHLFDRKADSISEIEDITFISFHQIFYREDMRLCKIRHMNIVPDAGPVFGRIIGSENTDRFSFSVRHLKDQRNQMGLRIVGLADLSAFMGSACIKIAQ